MNDRVYDTRPRRKRNLPAETPAPEPEITHDIDSEGGEESEQNQPEQVNEAASKPRGKAKAHGN
jgi:hypothetical protein